MTRGGSWADLDPAHVAHKRWVGRLLLMDPTLPHYRAVTGDPISGTAVVTRATWWSTLWAGVRAATGALLGLVPHVMHHIGFLAGAALLTGVVGNSVLYVAGLLLSIPMLNRLRKRFGTWKAPVIGVAVFSALFALSAFVIGPAFNPTDAGPAPTIEQAGTDAEHAGHHP